MKPIFIYVLRCPLDKTPRYIGKTDHPDRRLRVHLRDSRTAQTHCGRWVNNLRQKNLNPEMEILDVVPDNEADFWEREYIQNFLELGSPLTNLTLGGDGASPGESNPMFGRRGVAHPAFGYRHTPEALQRMRASKKGYKNPAFGKPPSEEARARQIAGQTGRKASLETRLRISLATKGSKNPMFGKHHSEQANQRKREASLQMWAQRKLRKKLAAEALLG